MHFKYGASGEWSAEDTVLLKEFLQHSTCRKALHQVELEIDGKLEQLGTIDLGDSHLRAMQVQSEIRGMKRVLDLLEELSTEETAEEDEQYA